MHFKKNIHKKNDYKEKNTKIFSWNVRQSGYFV